MTSLSATDDGSMASIDDNVKKMPITCEELMQLSYLMKNEESISSETVTMTTDTHVCVLDKTEDTEHLLIVDTETQIVRLRRPVSDIDSAILNSSSNLIAIRKAETLQIFDIDRKMKLKSYSAPEDVIFWTWISKDVVAIVTKTSCFHWNTTDDLDPVFVVKRPDNLNDAIVTDYRADKSLKWILVVYKNNQQDHNSDPGTIHIYSMERQTEQIVEGFVGSYTTLILEGRDSQSTLFVGVVEEQLLITEIGNSSSGKWKKSIDLDFAVGDFPIAIEVNERYATIFIITKHGFLHVYEVLTGKLLCVKKMFTNDVFVTAPMINGCGIAGVLCNGKVFRVKMDGSVLISYILNQLQDPELAMNLACHCDLSGAEQQFIDRFHDLLEKGEPSLAAQVAAISPKGILRTKQTIETLKSAISSRICSKPPILVYYKTLLERRKLNAVESVDLCKTVLHQGRNEMLRKWITDDKLTWSEEIGNILKELDMDKSLIFYMFLRSFLPKKIAERTSDMRDFGNALSYIKANDLDLDFTSFLRETCRVSPEDGLETAKIIVKKFKESLNNEKIVDIFMEFGLLKQCTEFLMDVLNNDKDSDGVLQTKVIELNLLAFPAVADAIIRSKMFKHFDKTYIAQLCIKVGLSSAASDLYKEVCRLSDEMGGPKQEHFANIEQMKNVALSDEMASICKEHDEVYQLFCFCHNISCCRKCLWTLHNNCNEVHPFEEAVDSVNLDDCLTALKTQCNQILSKIQSLRQSREERLTAITEARKQIESNIKRFRQELDGHLDNIQEEFTKNMYETETEAIKEIYKAYTSFIDMENKISTTQYDIQFLKCSYSDDAEFFLQIQHTSSKLKTFQVEINNLEQKHSIKRTCLSFCLNSCLDKLTENVTSFGNLTIYNEV